MIISELNYLEVVTEESSIAGAGQSNSSNIYQDADAGNNYGYKNVSYGNTAVNAAVVTQGNFAYASFNKKKVVRKK